MLVAVRVGEERKMGSESFGEDKGGGAEACEFDLVWDITQINMKINWNGKDEEMAIRCYVGEMGIDFG